MRRGRGWKEKQTERRWRRGQELSGEERSREKSERMRFGERRGAIRRWRVDDGGDKDLIWRSKECKRRLRRRCGVITKERRGLRRKKEGCVWHNYKKREEKQREEEKETRVSPERRMKRRWNRRWDGSGAERGDKDGVQTGLYIKKHRGGDEEEEVRQRTERSQEKLSFWFTIKTGGEEEKSGRERRMRRRYY